MKKILLTLLLYLSGCLNALHATAEQYQLKLTAQPAVSIKDSAGYSFSPIELTQPADLLNIKHWQPTQRLMQLNGSQFWVNITLLNPSDSEINKVLFLQRANLFEVDFYVFNSQQQLIQQANTGTLRPIQTNTINAQGFAFPLQLPAKSQQQVFLRIKSTGMNFFDIQLQNPDYFQANYAQHYLWEVSFYSILIFLFFYHILMFVFTRDYVFFVFSAFAIVLAYMSAADSGFLYQLAPWLRGNLGFQLQMVGLSLICIFVASVHQLFIRLSPNYPVLAYINNILRGSAVGVIFLLATPIFLIISKLNLLLFLVCLASTTLQIYYIAYKNKAAFKVIASVWSLFVLGALITFLSSMGLLVNNLVTGNAVYWSILLSYSVLSVSLAKRLQNERNLAQQAQLDNQLNISRFYDLFLNIEQGVFSCNDQGDIVDANPAFNQLLDVDKPQKHNIGLWFVDKHEKERIFAQLQTQGMIKNYEVQFINHKQRTFWLKLNLRKLSFANDQINGNIKGSILDITALKATEQKLAFISNHDPLTNLANRSFLLRQLTEFSDQDATKQPLACCLNINHFNLLNTSGGNDAGNQLLQLLANLLYQQLPKGHLLARIGNDEFFIFIPDIEPKQGIELMQTLHRNLFPLDFYWQTQLFTIQACFGVAYQHNQNESPLDLFALAVLACKTARQDNKQIELYQGQQQQQAYDLLLSGYHKVTQALQENRLCLFQQPIKPLQDKKLPWAREILVRLIDTQGKIVQPGAFLPAAERFNLMPEIDKWVIEHTAMWLQQHQNTLVTEQYICINLSAATLNLANSGEFISQLFKQYQIHPQQICFEITESMAINHLQHTKDFISMFKQLGCRFSLDDFGTGYSSYSYLQQLDVDILKIDGSFVKDIAHNKTSLTMVTSFYDIATALGLTTVAEYVENTEIEHIISQIGIDYAQGYGIKAPHTL